jgi:hypothetical protein
MKRLPVVVLGCGLLASAAGYAQPAVTASIVSAYQGNLGDWALGVWKGTTFDKDATKAGRGLNPYSVELLVEKQSDGKVLCKILDPNNRSAAQWAPQCAITANGLSMTTPNKNSVAVTRKDANLEGSFNVTNPRTANLGLQLTR